ESSHHDFISGVWPVVAAWIGFTVVSISTARNAYLHLLNFTRPDLQSHVLRIIVVGPIYAFSAALCLSLPDFACFFIRSVRDIWEAVVIYSFLTLVIEYMGGEHLCLHSISQTEEDVPHLFPCNLCFSPIPTGSMIRVPKMGALQFVAVKPVVAVMSIIVYACGRFDDWYYQWTIFVVYNISYSVALYALYLIYWASHEQEALQSRRPLLKFVSVKMIVFLTFWQALLLPRAPLPGNPSKWEDFILAIEMFVFSLLMNIAFSWREFQVAGKRPDFPRGDRGTKGPIDILDLMDLELNVQAPGKDCVIGASAGAQATDGAAAVGPKRLSPLAASAPEPVGRGKLVQNARAAFCPRDIMQDASNNFSKRYQQHVCIESAQEYELENEAEKPPQCDDLDLFADEPSSAANASSGTSGLSLGSLRHMLGRSRGSSSAATDAAAAETPETSVSSTAVPPSEAAETAAPLATAAEISSDLSSLTRATAGDCASASWPAEWPVHAGASLAVAGAEWPPVPSGAVATSKVGPPAVPGARNSQAGGAGDVIGAAAAKTFGASSKAHASFETPEPAASTSESN
ncbi:unnamed protein product, partial [Polarella glacialis]